MKPFITLGCMTDHGGIVVDVDHSFLVEGIGVHLEGMKHFCPKCKLVVSAISTGQGFVTVGSKTIIMADDVTTCGAKFLAKQSLVVRDAGSGSGKGNAATTNFLQSSITEVFDEQIVTEFSFFEGMPYFIETACGQIHKGTIGADGKLPRVSTEGQGSYTLYLGDEAIIKGNEDAS